MSDITQALDHGIELGERATDRPWKIIGRREYASDVISVWSRPSRTTVATTKSTTPDPEYIVWAANNADRMARALKAAHVALEVIRDQTCNRNEDSHGHCQCCGVDAAVASGGVAAIQSILMGKETE
jgi:hypothetical protein